MNRSLGMSMQECIDKQRAIEQLLEDLKILNQARINAVHYGSCHIRINHDGTIEIVDIKELVSNYLNHHY